MSPLHVLLATFSTVLVAFVLVGIAFGLMHLYNCWEDRILKEEYARYYKRYNGIDKWQDVEILLEQEKEKVRREWHDYSWKKMNSGLISALMMPIKAMGIEFGN